MQYSVSGYRLPKRKFIIKLNKVTVFIFRRMYQQPIDKVKASARVRLNKNAGLNIFSGASFSGLYQLAD